MLFVLIVLVMSGLGWFVVGMIRKQLTEKFKQQLAAGLEKNKKQFEEDFKTQKAKCDFQAGLEAQRHANNELGKWKNDHEKQIRKDAVMKSKSITLGKVSEQLFPFFPNFNYNPKDARFLGSPTDLIIFDGLDGGELKKIIFVEVKTGKAKLNKREEQVRNIVQNRQVEWVTIELPTNEGEV
jgi:predicted Holliday junction resolvase-like endonuclease